MKDLKRIRKLYKEKNVVSKDINYPNMKPKLFNFGDSDFLRKIRILLWKLNYKILINLIDFAA